MSNFKTILFYFQFIQTANFISNLMIKAQTQIKTKNLKKKQYLNFIIFAIFYNLKNNIYHHSKQGVIIHKGYIPKFPENAIKGYLKMGYTLNDEIRYGFSFSFPMKKNEKLTKQMLLQPISQCNIIEAQGPSSSEIIGLKAILNKKPTFDGFSLSCFKGNELVAYCEFYYRLFLYYCSLKYFVEVFYAKEGSEREICQSLVKYIYQRHELNFEEIFFIKRGEKNDEIEDCFPEGQNFDLVGMEKNISPSAKL